MSRHTHSNCQRAATAVNSIPVRLSFPPNIAPIKCAILPIVNKDELNQASLMLARELKKLNLHAKVEHGGVSIGKRYVKCDEMGIPFAITVDSEAVETNRVTLRDCNSREQIRKHVVDVPGIISSLVSGEKTWTQIKSV